MGRHEAPSEQTPDNANSFIHVLIVPTSKKRILRVAYASHLEKATPEKHGSVDALPDAQACESIVVCTRMIAPANAQARHDTRASTLVRDTGMCG